MRAVQREMDRVSRVLYARRFGALGLLALLAALVTIAWVVRLSAPAPRRQIGPVNLATYGLGDVDLALVHPRRLGAEVDGDISSQLTLLATARSPDATAPLEIVLPLQDGSVGFVNAEGNHIPGRVTLAPGYPDVLPADIGLAHSATQFGGQLLRSHRVTVSPVIRSGDDLVPITSLTFTIVLESRLQHAVRTIALSFSRVAVPYLFAGAVTMLLALGWRRASLRRRAVRDKELSVIYVQIREDISLERWSDARDQLERMRLLEPEYRDVDQLDTLVSTAETAAWRREQLYRAGVQAYRDRDWPAAIQAFVAIEKETPYYQDVRFLRRTAALYADLCSRDRTLRVSAAQQLGEVADLIDPLPLREALGDPSSLVADAAEVAFRTIGLVSCDVLLDGLVEGSPQVSERCRRLLEGFGQDARDSLVCALRSSDPRLSQHAASMLARLGARRELAQSLLWIAPEHQEGVIQALLTEGAATFGVLVDALFQAPPERQQCVLNALSAMKVREGLDKRIEAMRRADKDPQHRELLRRALDAHAATGRAETQSTPVDPRSECPSDASPDQPENATRARLLRLLDRRRS